jgi:hypothetical protein
MGASEKRLEKERRAYERETIRALGERAKGTDWNKRMNVVFRESESFFFTASINVWLNADKATWRIEAKPMAADPVFWSIMEMEANQGEPLSLRAWGAFVCDGVPVADSAAVPSVLSADRMAEAFLSWADDESTKFAKEWKARAFSDLIRSHEDYRARGAYAATLVSALIAEGRIDDAAQTARDFASGVRSAVHQQTSGGVSFFERAVAWIESNGGKLNG